MTTDAYIPEEENFQVNENSASSNQEEGKNESTTGAVNESAKKKKTTGKAKDTKEPLAKKAGVSKKTPNAPAKDVAKKSSTKKNEPVIEKATFSDPSIKKAASKKAVAKKAAPKKAAVKPEAPKEIEIKVKKVAKKVAAIPEKASANKKAKSDKVPTAIQSVSPTDLKETAVGNGIRRVVFQLRFFTHHGQTLSVTGNHPLLGNNEVEKAFPLQFLDRDNWYAVLDLPEGEVINAPISYNYILHDVDGNIVREWGNDKLLDPSAYQAEELLLIDSWNDSSFIENSFYTEPFKQVLLKDNFTPIDINEPADFTHLFKVKAPLLQKGEVMCLLGSSPLLGSWNKEKPILMQRKEEDDYFTVKLDLSAIPFPIVYKYGVYNVNSQSFVRFEDGNNRIIFDSISPKKLTIVSDGFAVLPNQSFKGAGVAIPVFSLRSNNGYGVGEFNDIKLIVDWAKHVGLKLVQILPINDTTATHTFADSYPYAAISAFALHPIYLHIPAIIRNADTALLEEVQEQRQALQQLPEIDYEAVMELKWKLLRQIFPAEKEETFSSDNFLSFFEANKHWLVPYAAFSYFRDQNGTADFSKWSSHSVYNQTEVHQLAGDPNTAPEDVAIHFFIQYHLHLQLQAATSYAHANGIIVKGDIPIGIYRNSCDAWEQPELYNMEMQAGAPPDDFAIKGQNWGFPTYNWQRMQQDGFKWWRLRFEQMSNYFDAFRIDHILGFFRIWSIPMDAVEGIMGHFVPALPVHINEFHERGLSFDRHRFVEPFINDAIIYEMFGAESEKVKAEYLEPRGNGEYTLKSMFKTQRAIEAHFAVLGANEYNDFLKQRLFDLISNVLMFEVEGSFGQQFHMRIAMFDTYSFKYLDDYTKQQLSDIYINYFYRRQDAFWEREAMNKLPELKRSTNMLICGEDLGMVPDCVPGVMKRLSILSLEIQRMPKDPKREFFHPNDAPYLSVVTPSTHDMSTIRGWWEEDRAKTQHFFNFELGQWGDAPYFCEPWINKAIVLQHLHSPAMWSIFQLQDILGINGKIRRENPNEERINIPADPKHYWRYRIHIPLEELMQEEAFNDDFRTSILASGRG